MSDTPIGRHVFEWLKTAIDGAGGRILSDIIYTDSGHSEIWFVLGGKRCHLRLNEEWPK